MFKPGDRVKLKKHIDIYGAKINKDIIYTVMYSYFGQTMEMIELNHSYHEGDLIIFSTVDYYVADHFEMDIKHTRKEKLDRLCSK